FSFNEMSTDVEEVQSPRTHLDLSFADRKTLRSSLIKHVNRQKSPGRKTVSFSSRNNDKKISNVSDCWHYMQTGSEFIKLRGPTRHFRRFFSLDADLSHIRWTPTNKKPHKARIAIEDIREIRVGKNTEQLRHSDANFGELQDECLFSIIYGDDYETLDLVASCADDANIWVTGLMALTSTKYDCKPTTIAWATLRERWLGSVFDEEDPDGKGYIDQNTAVQLIRQTNPTLSLTRIKNKVKEAACGLGGVERGRIQREEFIELYKEIATRPEVYFLMVRYANKDYLSCQDLRLFLETEQGMSGVTTEFCENVVEQYEPAPEAKENNFMTVDGFTAFLLSKDCSIFDPSHSRVWMDMKQPFSKYFIAASNKTYLVEDQQGAVSVDGLSSALKRNCRLVEIDIFDPSEAKGETEPMIQNGMVANSKMPLSQALKVIRETAFERTRYPLLLRLCVHCSEDWQKVAAKLIVTHLGTKLYLPTADPTDWNNEKAIPTPWDFQSRVLIMGKRLCCSAESGEVSEDDHGIASCSRRKSQRIRLCRELSDLVPPFLQVKSLHDLMATAPNSSTMNPRNHVAVLSETTALRLTHTYAQEFSQMSRNYVVSVGPNPSRSDSSNLNPQEFWNHGIQLVGLNYQTPGLMIDLQEGRFSENGGCGYVLKPAIMNEDLFVAGEKPPTTPQILHLRVLSGQQLPRPRNSNAKGDSSDPFVVIEIFGIPGDCAEERTKTVRNDGHNPSFDESFQFQVSVPELALVRFLVLDDDFIGDDFIGQYTIPFECLQPGFRHVPLLNSEGDPLPNATLFVHVAVTNKRGGGKAKKRGMSVKRKSSRVNTGMKLVGIKAIDDQFKTAVAPLCESIAMRNKLEAALVDWQEECGLGPAGTIRQGIRLIHSRMITLAVNTTPPSSPSAGSETSRSQDVVPSFMIDSDDKSFPVIIVTGQIPDQLQRTFQKLKTLISHCVATLGNADTLLTKIEESIKHISESHDELAHLCLESGLKGQKATRAAENFTWNLRLLKAQLNLVSKSQDEAQDIITQVFDTGGVLGILSPKMMGRGGRRFSRVIHDPIRDSAL
uniref:Phosphoinositide phospholipase C n=2 Tax=Haemonchus contortus TaxID=6289 RepID=A0A7I4YAT9_HAECO